jgi:hypothetical protein
MSSFVQTVQGDLLTHNSSSAERKVTCHQCNCTTNRAFGLSSSINKMYPYANIYSGKRKVASEDRKPGSIIVRESAGADPVIINLLGQVFPSKPSSDPTSNDTYTHRLSYFKESLQAAINWCKEHEINSLMCPYGIGCGLAGGKWKDYEGIIKTLAETNQFHVVLVQFDK